MPFVSPLTKPDNFIYYFYRMEYVILVNENDEQTGIMEKVEAHEKAILHRAFSVFIFNNEGDMLLQKRAEKKYHSGGLWTNACCSHPRPGEDVTAAAERRLKEELGFSTALQKRFSFIYKAAFDNGLTEHEYDHVFTGMHNGPIQPNLDEAEDYSYKSLSEIDDELNLNPDKFTVWFRIAFPKLKEYFQLNSI